MSDRELGKIAYEAYCETAGWPGAIFEKTREAVQKGWIAAAKAVQMVCIGRVLPVVCMKCGKKFSPPTGMQGLVQKGVCLECWEKELGSGA